MCGIAGIVAPGGFDPATLMSMTHLVSYRGPDAFGFAYRGSTTAEPLEFVHNENRLPRSLSPVVVGLGNRRLAIVDLSPRGNMPMQSEDGQFAITYNGEIYNHTELRCELEARGHRFYTQTDTEVVLHAYLEWREGCLERFNGMWSFGLWDNSAGKLFCARDRLGVKPFYYGIIGDRFYFASEIKQILHASGMPRMANPRTVFHFLDSGLIDYSPETFFQGIQQLPGGHWLTLELDNSAAPTVQCYWNLPIDTVAGISDEDAVEGFRNLFADAVKLRLRSDVPVGMSLSGGLDSSSVVCQARLLAPLQLFSSFSACFEEPALDERDFISAVVGKPSATIHWSFPQKEAFWENIEKVLYHLDEPTPSTNIFAQWTIMAEARRSKIPVLLGGQGADEILCGYQKYRYFYLWHLLRTGDARLVRESALWFRNGTRSRWTLADARNYLPARMRRPFSLVERVCPAEFTRDFEESQLSLSAGSSIQDRQKTDVAYASLPALLHYEDRNSMAHSIETRLPFVDYRLVEFAVGCPASMKLRDGWSKWMLRQALKGTLPEKVRLRRTKLGFDTPQAAWVSYGLQNGHSNLVESPNLQMERFLSPLHLAREGRSFLCSEKRALPAGSLFRALSLELWARVYGVS